jgi:hypothetical protein
MLSSLHKLTSFTGTSGKDAQNRAQQGFDIVSVASIDSALAEKMQAELDTAAGQSEGTKVERSY